MAWYKYRTESSLLSTPDTRPSTTSTRLSTHLFIKLKPRQSSPWLTIDGPPSTVSKHKSSKLRKKMRMTRDVWLTILMRSEMLETCWESPKPYWLLREPISNSWSPSRTRWTWVKTSLDLLKPKWSSRPKLLLKPLRPRLIKPRLMNGPLRLLPMRPETPSSSRANLSLLKKLTDWLPRLQRQVLPLLPLKLKLRMRKPKLPLMRPTP